ncbi:hypothetical protein TraAM80_05366 [Trypanosoma rangeli]|uniref:Uncharacterized protein n=1 Tax=Trypanosoma rangeli TaxID=5698 RepID=A0A3R7K9Q0_TRYRA|nr:uncharacterized protein TraAM80_05366 [Trypanosoma rangeli]RNF03982.1 hypothetical protein TraAM80_05366 [Trypanosoma rangeli]|eukprot:RNF03982.1 hypothetical protein TraAM80_05366 [Trypanosoma rangeli]
MQKSKRVTSTHSGVMTTSREEVVRAKLLAELSTLRERHSALQGQDGRSEGHRCLHEESPPGSIEKADTPLGQADRDAIEAFFNDAEDDFTRDFNEGRGKLERSELLDKLTMAPKEG